MSKPFLRVVAPMPALPAGTPTSPDDPSLPLPDRILVLAERELVGLDYGFSIDRPDEEEDDEQFERAAARQHQITDLMRNSVARSLVGLNAKAQVLKRLMHNPDGVEQIALSIIDDIARLLEEEKRR
jgi:hypothetical protein